MLVRMNVSVLLGDFPESSWPSLESESEGGGSLYLLYNQKACGNESGLGRAVHPGKMWRGGTLCASGPRFFYEGIKPFGSLYYD